MILRLLSLNFCPSQYAFSPSGASGGFFFPLKACSVAVVPRHRTTAPTNVVWERKGGGGGLSRAGPIRGYRGTRVEAPRVGQRGDGASRCAGREQTDGGSKTP